MQEPRHPPPWRDDTSAETAADSITPMPPAASPGEGPTPPLGARTRLAQPPAPAAVAPLEAAPLPAEARFPPPAPDDASASTLATAGELSITPMPPAASPAEPPTRRAASA